jgi:hypothetical protein
MACVIASSIALASSCLDAEVPSSLQVVMPNVAPMLLWVSGRNQQQEGPVHCKVEGQVQRQSGKGRIAFLV